MENTNNQFHSRLLQLFQKAQGDNSLNTFAKKAGLSPGTLSKIINGKQAPKPNTLEKIANATHSVTYHELMVAAGYIKSEEENEPQKKEETIGGEISSKFKFASEKTSPFMIQKASLVDIIPGDVDTINNEDLFPQIYYSDILFGSGKYAFFIMNDESFEPVIKQGSMLLINTKTEVKEGKPVLLSLNRQQTLLRRIYNVEGKYQLYGDNPHLSPLTADPKDIIIFGVLEKAIISFEDF